MNQQTQNDFKPVDMILLFLRGTKRYFVLAFFFACASSLAEMLRPKIIEYTVDDILSGSSASAPSWLISDLWIPAAAVIAVTLLAVVLHYFYEMCVVRGGEGFVCSMRDHLFEHIEHLSAGWHSSHQTGDIIQRCTTDVETVKTFISEQFVQLFSMIVTIALSLIFIIQIEPALAVIAAASVPVIVGISFRFHKGISKTFLECDENEGILSGIAQENLSGVRVVRAFGREKSERERFRTQNETVTDHWIRLGRYMSSFYFVIDFISGAVLLLILVAGTVMCVNSSLTVGALLAVISYLTMMTGPVRRMGRILSEMSKAGVSVNRLHEIMCAPAEPDAPDAPAPPMNGDIVFDHVSFAYPGQPLLFDDISFTVPAGTTLGILGTTGSGKSTLIQLLTRFYTLPGESGRITIGGTDIRDIPASWLRRNISCVMQEPYLFSRSIAENIAIADPDGRSFSEDAPDFSGTDPSLQETVTEACRLADLSETVEHFPNGYDTFVGERGVTLSGGQQQRTAIARALAIKAPILILDDALSAVDAQTDARIRSNLSRTMKESTVILISHRIPTLMSADQIIILRDGKIEDRGTHSELISRPGLYRDIYNIQTGQEENDYEQ